MALALSGDHPALIGAVRLAPSVHGHVRVLTVNADLRVYMSRQVFDEDCNATDRLVGVNVLTVEISESMPEPCGGLDPPGPVRRVPTIGS